MFFVPLAKGDAAPFAAGGRAVIMTQIFNRQSEKETRQALRISLPTAELILWSKLKNRQICGRRFRRQFSIGRYVVDFYCPELKLAIEVDGYSHYQPGEQERDETRQRSSNLSGFSFCDFATTKFAGILGEYLKRFIGKQRK